MDTPNLLKGHLYPSNRVSRCPRFHACVACKKCQNFDRHQLDCQVCESRVYPKPLVCDHIPEGEFIPDIQNSIRIMELFRNEAMAHPDREGQIIDGKEITNKYEKARQASNLLHDFTSSEGTTTEEKVVRAYLNKEQREKLIGKKL